MKKYEVSIKGLTQNVYVSGGNIFIEKKGKLVKVRTKRRVITWLYDHDAIKF